MQLADEWAESLFLNTEWEESVLEQNSLKVWQYFSRRNSSLVFELKSSKFAMNNLWNLACFKQLSDDFSWDLSWVQQVSHAKSVEWVHKESLPCW